MKFLSKLWDKWGTEGMKWPFVHDPVKNKPSITLLFFYVAFFITALSVGVSSLMLLISGQYLSATFVPVLLFCLTFVFYRLRRLDSFKLDLDDKSIELTGNSDE